MEIKPENLNIDDIQKTMAGPRINVQNIPRGVVDGIAVLDEAAFVEEPKTYILENKLAADYPDQAFLSTSVGFNLVTSKDLRRVRARRKMQRAARRINRRRK